MLADVVESMISSRNNWKTFSAFAEKVMRAKEEEERRRERAISSSPSPAGDDDPG